MKNSKYAIGVGLNLFDASAILLREDGKVMVRCGRKRNFTTVNETINLLISLFEDILNKSARYKDRIAGAGIALGGVVNDRKGVVYWPQCQDHSCVYISVPFKKYLEEKFSIPIFMENDANSCAWAEYKTNFSGCKNLVYIFSGVGCGIIIDGRLYRGRDGGAGELFVSRAKNMDTHLGNFDFLTQWPQDLGIVEEAKQEISRGRESSLLRRIDSVGGLSPENVFKEAAAGDSLSSELLKKAAFALGVKISFLIDLLNPEVIVIGGGFEEAGEFFLGEVLRVIRKFSFSALRKNLKVRLSSLGRDTVPLGVAGLFFQEKTLQI